MNYQDTSKALREAFPDLFPTEDDLLIHLFYTTGSGFHWIDGELSDGITTDPEEYIKIQRESRIYLTLRDIEAYAAHHNLNEAYAQAQTRLEALRHPNPERDWAAELTYRRDLCFRGLNGVDNCWFVREDGTVGNVIHWVTDYACIFSIPDDVRPDWVDAARRAIELIGRSRVNSEDLQMLARAALKFKVGTFKEVEGENS